MHTVEQYLLGIAAVLVTVLLVILDFKSKALHNLQVQLLEQRYENDKAAIDKGIKEHDNASKKAHDAFYSAYENYVLTHVINK